MLLRFNFIFFPKQIQTYFSQIKYRLKSYKVIQIRFLWNLYGEIFLVSTQQPTKTVQLQTISTIYYQFTTSESSLPASTGNVIVRCNACLMSFDTCLLYFIYFIPVAGLNITYKPLLWPSQ